MNEKEFNGLILAELVKIANDVFTNEIEIAPGTYTAAELAKLKDANGNEINIKYLCVDAKLNITDFRTVQINSFKCSFPVDQVFNLVWQFEKLIGTKQANKTRFTKIEERENIVCSFDMWITKEHLNITKLVTKGTKEANKPKLQPFQTNYYIHQESLWKRINKPKEVIAETNRLRKVRSMLLDWILIWLILSESNRT